jgi:hypothetical protein
MKELRVSKFDRGLLVTTQFDTSAISNPKIDALVNLLDLAIVSCEAESTVVSGYEILVIPPDEIAFCKKLAACGFTVVKHQRVALQLKMSKPREPIRLNVKPKNSYITLSVSDLKQLALGPPFKGFETVISKPFLSVEQILDTTIKTISTKSSSVFSMIDFISRIEEANRILCRFPQFFKDTDRKTFVHKRRNEELAKVYDEFFESNEDPIAGSIVTLSSGDWSIVDGHRIYDLIYKFGSKNDKVVYKHKNSSIFRAFRGDFVFMVEDSLLKSTETEIRVRVKPLNSLLITG